MVSIKWATEGTQIDTKNRRLLLSIGDKQYHLTQEEGRKLLKQLQARVG